MLIAGVVVLVAAIGGATYYFTHATAAAAAPAPKTPGIVPLAPFVVNLADPGAQRFLKITLQLVVDEEEAAALEKQEVKKAQVRSAVLELLTAQHGDQLITPEGKTELKKSICERASEALKPVEVTDVLFTEFVVQF
jgi:flagellar FliL protein